MFMYIYVYVLYALLYTIYYISLCYIVLSQGQAFYVVQSVNGQSSQATVYSGKREGVRIMTTGVLLIHSVFITI